MINHAISDFDVESSDVMDENGAYFHMRINQADKWYIRWFYSQVFYFVSLA